MATPSRRYQPLYRFRGAGTAPDSRTVVIRRARGGRLSVDSTQGERRAATTREAIRLAQHAAARPAAPDPGARVPRQDRVRAMRGACALLGTDLFYTVHAYTSGTYVLSYVTLAVADDLYCKDVTYQWAFRSCRSAIRAMQHADRSWRSGTVHDGHDVRGASGHRVLTTAA